MSTLRALTSVYLYFVTLHSVEKCLHTLGQDTHVVPNGSTYHHDIQALRTDRAANIEPGTTPIVGGSMLPGRNETLLSPSGAAYNDQMAWALRAPTLVNDNTSFQDDSTRKSEHVDQDSDIACPTPREFIDYKFLPSGDIQCLFPSCVSTKTFRKLNDFRQVYTALSDIPLRQANDDLPALGNIGRITPGLSFANSLDANVGVLARGLHRQNTG